jgi:hypothetical protein
MDGKSALIRAFNLHSNLPKTGIKTCQSIPCTFLFAEHLIVELGWKGVVWPPAFFALRVVMNEHSSAGLVLHNKWRPLGRCNLSFFSSSPAFVVVDESPCCGEIYTGGLIEWKSQHTETNNPCA